MAADGGGRIRTFCSPHNREIPDGHVSAFFHLVCICLCLLLNVCICLKNANEKKQHEQV